MYRHFTDPNKKKREKDEAAMKKKERKEKNKESKEKLENKLKPWEKHIPGSRLNEREREIVPSMPLPDPLDIYKCLIPFRAKIKTDHKTQLAVSSVLSLYQKDSGSVWEFTPAGPEGQYFISSFVFLGWLENPIGRVYLQADGSDLKLRLLLAVEGVQPQPFLLKQLRKNVCSITHVPSGKLVEARDNYCQAKSDKVGDRERFTVDPVEEKVEVKAMPVGRVYCGLGPMHIIIISRKQHMGLTATENGGNLTVVDKKSEPEVWELLPAPGGVTCRIRSAKTGRWWYVDGASGGVKVRDGEGEDFRIEGDWNDTAGIRHMASGKLLRAESAGVRAKKDKKGEGETFILEEPKQ